MLLCVFCVNVRGVLINDCCSLGAVCLLFTACCGC